ncbi:MAG: zinc-binding dehydrogenase [Terriglobia bacterium]
MPAASMAAIVHYALEKYAVELREVPRPGEPGDDEVLLSTRAVGVCGSEIHQFHNTQSWPVNIPVILGHEFSGVVSAVGKRAAGFREGDRVVSETAASICGQCAYCRSGEYNLCPQRRGFGYGVNGAMADWVRVPARCLHRVPDSVSFEKASLTEPCCVAFNATCVHAEIHPGDSVLILGPGPIGLLCLELAKLAGASWVGVAGLKQDAARMKVAQALGVDCTLTEGEEQIREVVKSMGDGLGVDVVIDAAGASAALKTAMAVVRPGGQITKVGWGPQPLNFSLDPLVQKAIRLQGSFSHNYRMWEKVLALLASGKLDPLRIVGRIETYPNWRTCFDEMTSGEIVKAVLTPTRASG